MSEGVHRPHLLYVAWGFPPCRGGGVYRALATANAFAREGWDVTVLTVPRETFLHGTGADPALEAQVDPRLRIERIPFTWPFVDNDLARWSRWRVLFPRLWTRARKRLDRLPFPEVGYGPWRRELERAAERVHAAHPVDLVLATANPQVTLTAALHLHQRHGVPYVVDYRDAWSLDVFSGRRLHGEGSRVHRWEARALRGCREMWVVNEPIRRWHAQAYPEAADRIHVVSNGFDPDPARGRPRPAADPLVFGYLGTVTNQVPVEAFLSGWGLADVGSARTVVRGHLGHYATPSPVLAKALEDAAPQGVSYGGPVSKTAVGEVYAGFDVLLLILGTGAYVTSGKVFEYLATGLPVVSVHDPGNAASDVLRDYPRWHPAASLEPADVARALEAAAADARHPAPGVVDAALAYAERFSRDRQLLPRVRALSPVPAAP